MTIEREDTRLAEPASGPPSAAGPLLRALERMSDGDEIARFRVRRILGEGGMGLVYLAEDPHLGRHVAVKLLRPLPGSRAEEHQRRLLREAQVLARVAHKNLVTVYEVGVHDGVVFVAMEYVRGRTLDAWLKQKERGWAEILRAFIEAGHGLAAVHEAGLVHRDFKPGNVMVADDGRVLILDFGLARPSLTERGPGAEVDDSGNRDDDVRPADDTLGQDLTRAGGVLGTPAYMAPEQHLAIPADARADQFSFCVALYEALYGERPFRGRDEIELMEAVLRGLQKLPATRGDLPLEVRRAIQRGMSVDREARFASMNDLLDVLSAAVGTARPTRRVAPMAVAAAALVVFTAGVTWRLAGGGATAEEPAESDGATAGPEQVDAPDRDEDARGRAASPDEDDAPSLLPNLNELPGPLEDEPAPATSSAGAVIGLPVFGDSESGAGGFGGLPGVGDDDDETTGGEAPVVAATSGSPGGDPTAPVEADAGTPEPPPEPVPTTAAPEPSPPLDPAPPPVEHAPVEHAPAEHAPAQPTPTP
jgi:predicted Ser/Thr protein kinase